MIIPSPKSALTGFFRRYGPSKIKQKIWDAEYKKGKWLIPVGTDRSDILYSIIERYLKGGDILDLGCGNARFLRLKDICRIYTGVDISNSLIQQEKSFQYDRAEYYVSNIEEFIPSRKYGVILFSESIYYIPYHKILKTLIRYKNYLEDGAFVVRMWNKDKYEKITELIDNNFIVLEKHISNKNGITIAFH
jgi:SAM-dependent methyltransferase